MHTSTRLLLASLTVAASTLSPMALAAPVVQAGSTYDMRFFGEGINGVISVAPIVFDGLGESFTRVVGGNSRQITVNESQTDLGSGDFLISVWMTADGSLSPGSTLFGSTGNNDPFNLLESVRIVRVLQTFSFFNSPDFVQEITGTVAFPNPWNGSVPLIGNGVGVTGLPTGTDVRGIRYDMTVASLTAVPEPGALALVGVALAAMSMVRRRAAHIR